MLIQCQSCTHKFRLNLERLPARKTFVRCKNCGTPIYIHGEEEEASVPMEGMADAVTVPEQFAESPVIPPWLAGMPPAEPGDSVIVTCPQCESRYNMPAAPLRRPDIRLKCTQCEHVFVPPLDLLHVPTRGERGTVFRAEEVSHTPGASEFPPYSDMDADVIVPPERVILEPDDARMSALVDDMAPGSGIRRSTPTPPLKDPTRPSDPEFDYLEATSLGDEYAAPEHGTVPEATKYGLFLKAGELPSREPEPSMQAPPPEMEVDAEPPLPPLPGEVELDAELPPLETDQVAEPLPPMQEPPAAAPPLEPPQDLPPLPMLQPEPRKAPDKQIVPDQLSWLSERTRYLVLGLAAALVLVAAGIWTVWLWQSPGSAQRYTVETGRVHQLALEDDLVGRYVINKPTGERLFVVQGVVENHFASDTEISWIRLRGSAYTDRNQTQTLATSFAFIGNVLSDAQLASWEPEAIQAFHAYNNGRDNANFRIPTGAHIPFQLVFSNVRQPVGRTVAQVVSYHRNNLTVYVDPGR